MKGSTHLAIGAAIGVFAGLYYNMDFKEGALCVAAASFSALSADLDGNSILSGKIDKVSKWLREGLLGLGIISLILVSYLYFYHHLYYLEWTAASGALFLVGFISRQGVIRNLLLSLIGAGLIYGGWQLNMTWLSGLGLFIAWVPWLKHRGMTHTLWAVWIWWAIGAGLERQVEIEGLAAVSAISYLSHLLADTLTPSGVKWLYPLYKKPFRLPLR
ncbi:metal-dependent hydrolase [Paenibacillus sp. J2TS4]|uniref:metal-dependent hydrolase n=1 Tax=Paenibacillus sp. J2TS4 TaxID=2807194 RepID=UPI001B165928|nr:metal-dependent hydrolase [Paenibacillus sp. J2TS4]GIP36186.1 membrane protein [Paenibacillus sp. J2TS4]